MNPFSLGLLLAAVTTFTLALWVFFLRSRRRMHTIFILYLASVGFWAAFSAVQTLSPDPGIVLLAARLMHWGAIFISVFFLHFLYHLTGKIKWKTVAACYAIAFVFLALNHTPLFVAGIKPQRPFHYFMAAGPVYPAYIVFFLVTWSYAVLHLFTEMKKSEGGRRTQLKFLFIGSLIGYVGGSGAFLPVYNLNFPIVYPYGSFAIALTVSVMTYDIVRHGLLDIELIIKRAIVFAALFVAVLGAFVGVTVLTQELVAGGRLLGLAISSVMIILTVRPLENFLVNVTDKFLFQKKYNPIELIRAFTQEVVTEYNLSQIAKMTVQKLSEILRVESCAVFIPDKDRERFFPEESRGLEGKKVYYVKEYSKLLKLLDISGGVVLKNNALDKEVLEDLKIANAELALSIASRKETVGLLTLGKKKSDEDFTKEDIEILKSFAGALGLAINTAIVFEDAMQKEKLVTVGTMVAGIRHDISNPVQRADLAIQQFELDKEQGRHAKMPPGEFLSEVYNLINRCRTTFQKVMAISAKFSDIARPKSKSDLFPVKLSAIVENCLGVFDYELGTKNIRLTKEISPNDPEILCDQDYIEQILFNLIRNAVYAIEEAKRTQGLLSVGLKLREDKIMIEIEDNGTGIPQDKLQKIFDAYYTTKPEGVGTGLGLVIVKELTERMKGTVSVKSVLGEGTTFILEFEGVPPSNLTRQF